MDCFCANLYRVCVPLNVACYSQRFLKPSQVPGIDTEAFMRQQQIACNLHEQSILGYRGLVGELTFVSVLLKLPIYSKIKKNWKKCATFRWEIIYTFTNYISFIIIQTIDCRFCKDFNHTVHSLISKRCSFILPKIAWCRWCAQIKKKTLILFDHQMQDVDVLTFSVSCLS